MKKVKRIKLLRPTNSGSRGASFVIRTGVSKDKPKKSLTIKHKRSLGRDNTGQVSVRHKGGGHQRKYRIVTTIDKSGIGDYIVEKIEYDPNRSSYIALIKNTEGKYSYIIAPAGIKIGEKVAFSDEGSINTGDRTAIGNIPTGIAIHSIEITPHSKAKMVRAAGTKAIVMAREGKYTLVKLPSGEIRKFNNACLVSIGSLSNELHNMIKIGKAGRKRHMGIRPTVRGKAMHPAAHPHGGGEGVNPIGLKHPKTPWGKPAMGYRTSRKTNQFIVKRRPKRRK